MPSGSATGSSAFAVGMPRDILKKRSRISPLFGLPSRSAGTASEAGFDGVGTRHLLVQYIMRVSFQSSTYSEAGLDGALMVQTSRVELTSWYGDAGVSSGGDHAPGTSFALQHGAQTSREGSAVLSIRHIGHDGRPSPHRVYSMPTRRMVRRPPRLARRAVGPQGLMDVATLPAIEQRATSLSADVAGAWCSIVSFLFRCPGACRRRKPRNCADPKVPKGASHRDLSDDTP